ncbi:hypothetical protein [Bacillus suaedaesalsae]|uniref:DUF1404 domain-containing protein n=1 Tax=Bacillus suaedaesalsae TaxID=2810349 RepID=A0ABS2DLV8_9BACI|nr:hypothetical protein [Bacillus suaedaesalsae]MBM6619490.1 hypothetical protein [Bacillus suaedaesalsae]
MVKQLLWLNFILSWVSFFFIPKKSVKQYIPTAILAALLVTYVYEMSHYFKWWKVKKPIIPWVTPTDISYVLGPFFIGTLWVFHLTFKSGFKFYLIINMILDGFFSYVYLPFIERLGVVKLKNINRTGIYLMMLLIAIIIYPFQIWKDQTSKEESSTE